MKATKIRTTKTLKYPVVGQWHFVITLHPIYWSPDRSIFEFGFFKLNNLPPEGEVVQKKHYKGFWWKWEFQLFSFGTTYNFPKWELIKQNIRSKWRLIKWNIRYRIYKHLKNGVVFISEGTTLEGAYKKVRKGGYIIAYDPGSPEGDKSVTVIAQKGKDNIYEIHKK